MHKKRFAAPIVAVAGLCLAQAPPVAPQAPPKLPPMNIYEYQPASTLAVPQHPLTRARFPVIDVHNHQDSAMPAGKLDPLVRDMDRINLRMMVNRSGGYGDRLQKGVQNMRVTIRSGSWCSQISASRESTSWATRSGPHLSWSRMSGTERGV